MDKIKTLQVKLTNTQWLALKQVKGSMSWYAWLNSMIV